MRMWVFPAIAAAIAAVFAGLLVRQFARRKRSYQLLWAISLVMYAVASIAVALGAQGHWSHGVYAVFWTLGAVLNVPFLAAGELQLLVRNKTFNLAVDLVLVVIVAYSVATVRGASFDGVALLRDLPSGKDVFGGGSAAHRLPQLVSYPSYFILVIGTLWSAWKMRGRPELKDRFTGTLWIALGATVIAGFGSAFAATGKLALFSISLAAGIAIMFVGFLRASRQAKPVPVSS
ncbi:MAG: hypothetical protein QOI81_2353 [Actinomycetota bacterium]|nr:hypothetical protein [Actinomycetota bacterium]